MVQNEGIATLNMQIGELKYNIMIQDTLYNLSNEDYHRGKMYKEYLGSTSLKDYLISPKFAKYKREHPQLFEISKDASEKGSLYHNCLESIVNTGNTSTFEQSVFIFSPPINEKTGKTYGYDTAKYQDALLQAQYENPNKEIVSKSDVDLIKAMIDELLNNCRQTSKDILAIMKWGKAEVSHFVEFEDCKFKYRPDVETKKKILDWKSVTADDLHEDTINKLIIKFKYDISAAFYQFMEHERSGIWKEFYWVFQQKSPPYDAVLVSAERWAYSEEDGIIKMGSGAHKFINLLNQHIYCTQNDDFDGAQVFVQPGFLNRRIMTPQAPNYDRLLTYYND